MKQEVDMKTKWCPKAMMMDDMTGPYNRYFTPAKGEMRTNCIGEECAVWVDGERPGTGCCGLSFEAVLDEVSKAMKRFIHAT